MSENIPESIPTSADPRSKRPTKRARPNPSANPLADSVSELFADPEKEVLLPPTSAELAARSSALAAANVPEIVTNVQGSSAGAGSGEFHVYKASRRREYDRIKKMDEEVEKEKADDEWEKKRKEREKEYEEKRLRNKAKRDKKRGKGGKGGNGTKDIAGTQTASKNGVLNGDTGKKEDKDRDGPGETDEAVAHTEEIGVVIHDED